jgi:hypothetical protein
VPGGPGKNGLSASHTDYLQPYASGHAPLPSRSFSVVGRLAYAYPF